MTEANQVLAAFAEGKAHDRLKALKAALRHVEKHPEKADPIHDLRVAIRKLTQSLVVFRELWDPRHYRKMRRKLRELRDLCGAVRNCDVAIEVLKEAEAQVPKAPETTSDGRALVLIRVHREQARRCARLRKHFMPRQRARAQEELSELLQRWDQRETVAPWRDWLRADGEHGRDVASFAKQTLQPLLNEFFEAGDRAAANSAQAHKFRLAAKRLRYSLEIFGPFSGGQWEQGIEEIRNLQERLGALNDCVTTRELIAESRKDDSNLLVKMLANTRYEIFRSDWNDKKKSKAWWLSWLGKRPPLIKKKRGT